MHLCVKWNAVRNKYKSEFRRPYYMDYPRVEETAVLKRAEKLMEQTMQGNDPSHDPFHGISACPYVFLLTTSS
jgi:hypothetical protein